jgi:hypothetical protein
MIGNVGKKAANFYVKFARFNCVVYAFAAV